MSDFSADLNVVVGFIKTLYEASETDMDVTIKIGLLNGILRNELPLLLTTALSRFWHNLQSCFQTSYLTTKCKGTIKAS